MIQLFYCVFPLNHKFTIFVASAVSGSLVGLALSQALILTGMLQYGIRQASDLINQLISVDRVLQYTKIEQEGPFETPDGKKS